MALSARNPLALNWMMLLAQGAVFALIYYFGFTFAINAFHLKTPGREEEVLDEKISQKAFSEPILAVDLELKKNSLNAPQDEIKQLAAQYLSVIGGVENVLNIDACISRLRLTLKEAAKVDEAAAKRLGASGVIRLNEQSVQIVVGTKAELIAAKMQELAKA